MDSQAQGAADSKLVRAVTVLAAIGAIGLALTLPGLHLWSGWHRAFAEVRAEARVAAAAVSELASRNPEFWQFEGHRVAGLLTLSVGAEAERWQVLAGTGEVVAELSVESVLPSASVSSLEPIFDAGRQVGSVEVSRGLQPLLGETVKVAVGAFGVAGLAFLLLRFIPLRLLDQALIRAAHLATHDTLTALPNRALFLDRLNQALSGGRRGDGAVAVLYLDLDHFKEVNDTLGHAAGDRLLSSVVGRISSCLRPADTLARLGGDEFGIVQVGARQPSDAEALARRLVLAVAEPFDLSGHRAIVGASIGISIRTEGHSMLDAGSLQQEADVALYRAKESGRGTYRFFEQSMHARLVARKSLEMDLRQALATNGFTLHYQPQVCLNGSELFGAEALIRWDHPVRGGVGPEAFIPLAEETGLIVPIGEWVLLEACREAMTWPMPLTIAVNVSPVQFRHAGFVDFVERSLQETRLDPGRLQIEVTEGILLTDTDETLLTLGRLRDLGITLAMDDFGTGYSSLGYLMKFRFDKIKIDRSFVHGLSQKGDAAAIVGAVVALCRSLGIRSNAEGVEDKTEADFLRAHGCEEVQGFHFGRPMSSANFHNLVVAQNSLERIPVLGSAS